MITILICFWIRIHNTAKYTFLKLKWSIFRTDVRRVSWTSVYIRITLSRASIDITWTIEIMSVGRILTSPDLSKVTCWTWPVVPRGGRMLTWPGMFPVSWPNHSTGNKPLGFVQIQNLDQSTNLKLLKENFSNRLKDRAREGNRKNLVISPISEVNHHWCFLYIIHAKIFILPVS